MLGRLGKSSISASGYKLVTAVCRLSTGASSLTTLSARQAVVRLIFINTLLMIGGIFYFSQPPRLEPGRIFREGHLMTWVSVFMLWGVGYLCRQIWIKVRKSAVTDWNEGATLWRVLFIGFTYLGFDELLKIHEAVDRYLHKMIGANPGGVSDSLDDLIIIMYGVVGLYFLWRYRRELFKYLSAWGYLFGACVCAGLSMVLDFVSGSREVVGLWATTAHETQYYFTIFSVSEEICKIYSEIFFLGAFIACLVKVGKDAHDRVPIKEPKTCAAA